jgi:hypothetical protein
MSEVGHGLPAGVAIDSGERLLRGRIEPFADDATIGCSLAHPEMLAAASPVCFRKITPIALASPRPPAPRRPAGLPSATPRDRRRRLRPGAECAGLGDVGAVGGDAGDDVLASGLSKRC